MGALGLTKHDYEAFEAAVWDLLDGGLQVSDLHRLVESHANAWHAKRTEDWHPVEDE